MSYTKINLTFAAILFISLFFVIPFYNQWLWGNVFNPNALISDQASTLDLNDRRIMKYGQSYKIFTDAVAVARKSNDRNIIVLLPPNSYLISHQIKNFRSVEPALFYYFTGCKAVWTNSPGVEQADWAIVAQNSKITLRRIENKKQLDDMLAIYKPYKPTL